MSQFEKPAGRVAIPLLIFGVLSLVMGVATELMGVLRGPSGYLRNACVEGGLVFRADMGLPDPAGLLVTSVACFGLVAAILGTPGGGRRFVLGFSAVFLSLALIPAFAVWGIFWKPFGTIIAVTWAWLSAWIYARSHRMPCEGEAEVPAANVIDLDGSRGAENYKRLSDGQS